MNGDDGQGESTTANPGYALGMLQRAETAAAGLPDAESRKRAHERSEDWRRVVQGMLRGWLKIGSRVPISGVPVWATPEVLTGGFASGRLAAGGPLQPHEQRLLSQLGLAGRGRRSINEHCLSEVGLAELLATLESGAFRLSVPEEGALLAVAWLLKQRDEVAAKTVLASISPWFDQLRFFPSPGLPDDSPPGSVHLHDVDAVTRQLAAVTTRPEIARMRETVQIWKPIYRRVVQLFLETVSGPPPRLHLGADGRPVERAPGSFVVDGGWPCQRYPEGWAGRGRTLLDDFRSARENHRLCAKPDRRSENLARLRALLEQCVSEPAGLSGREVGAIRVMLAAYATRWGLPYEPEWAARQKTELESVDRPTIAELARVLLGRLKALPPDRGLEDPERLAFPVSPEESEGLGVAAGHPMPERLRKLLRRCRQARPEALIESGVMQSAESLAIVAPRLAAEATSREFADPALRRLVRSLYPAFRRRRSLLLLDLEKQVGFEELPWVGALQAHREEGRDARATARDVLQQLTLLALTAFPQTILPNRLVREIAALARTAGLEVPIVEEVAADIFMGTFSAKYLAAAQLAARFLRGTLYERYYRIPVDELLSIDDVTHPKHGAAVSPAFDALCRRRANYATERRRSVAANGKVIEQEQILTTHNLAPLLQALELRDVLAPRLPTLVRVCFGWICNTLSNSTRQGYWPRLSAVKNIAYAWRQMIFLLALCPSAEVAYFLREAEADLAARDPSVAQRLRPALAGLERAAAGQSPEDPPRARILLGWTTGDHWFRQAL